MYHAHFDLSATPFSIAPDPHFLYMSERHREALAHLKWGLTSESGFVLLTGEVGTGKTTLSRCLLEQIPEAVEIAFVINPRLTAGELLETVCEELGIEVPEHSGDGGKPLVDAINRYLLEAHADGRRVVLVVDEAQNLATDVLEQIRLLTNLETNERKLLQVILLGQPELASKLAAPELRQLAQRITARFHLTPLSAQELSALVHHRLAVAGARRNPFDGDALTALHRHARGIPRLANVIADRALLGAYAEGTDTVTAEIVRRAAAEVLGAQAPEGATPKAARSPLVLTLTALVVVLCGAIALLLWRSPETAVIETIAADAALAPPSSSSPTKPTPAVVDDAARPSMARPDAARPDAARPNTAAPTGEPSTPPAAAAPLPEPRAFEAPTTQASLAVAPAAPRAAWFADLATQSEATSRLTAMRAVLAAWFAPLPLAAAQTPCAQIAGAGLACLTFTGSWPTLLDIDRPVILELWSDDAEPRHLAVVAVDGDRAEVDVDGSRQWIPRSEIDDYWRGAATVLWQMPPGYQGPSRSGDDDDTSAWLAERLAIVDDAPTATGRFDEALEARVRSFQLDAGLRPDGVVGPRTWMRLNDATGIGSPTLAAR